MKRFRITRLSAAATGLALLIGLACAAYFRPGLPKARTSSKDVSIGGELERLRDEVGELKQELSRRSRPVTIVNTSAAPEPSAPSPPSAAELAIERERQYLETKATFEHEFLRATGASEWGREREAALQATIAAAPDELGKQVTGLECRGDTCRLDTEHASAIEATAFMDEIEQRPGFQGTRFVRIRKQPGTEAYEFFVQPRAPSRSSP